MSKLDLFRFDSEEWDLFGNALNEVINGFDVPKFEYMIGMKRSSLEQLLEHIHALDEANELMLNISETRTVRNALRETIRELGVDEFGVNDLVLLGDGPQQLMMRLKIG